jgi:predicted transcriptional regulator
MPDFKSVRLSLNVSQQKLAQKSKVSRFKISSAEQAYCLLTKDEETRISQALKDIAHENSRLVNKELRSI